jgi:hypothetical protein
MSLFSENASIALNESLISLGVKSMKICAIIVNIIPRKTVFVFDEAFIQIK